MLGSHINDIRSEKYDDVANTISFYISLGVSCYLHYLFVINMIVHAICFSRVGTLIAHLYNQVRKLIRAKSEVWSVWLLRNSIDLSIERLMIYEKSKCAKMYWIYSIFTNIQSCSVTEINTDLCIFKYIYISRMNPIHFVDVARLVVYMWASVYHLTV